MFTSSRGHAVGGPGAGAPLLLVRRAAADRRRQVPCTRAGALLLVLRRARPAGAAEVAEPVRRHAVAAHRAVDRDHACHRHGQRDPLPPASHPAPSRRPRHDVAHPGPGARLAREAGATARPTPRGRRTPKCVPSAFQPSPRSAYRNRSSRTRGKPVGCPLSRHRRRIRRRPRRRPTGIIRVRRGGPLRRPAALVRRQYAVAARDRCSR